MAETGFKKWIITITVIIASLLELIDTTIVNVSIPQIQGNLGATLEDVADLVFDLRQLRVRRLHLRDDRLDVT